MIDRSSRAFARGALLLAALSLAVPAAAEEQDLERDLFAVIALEGKPCGEVVAVERRGANDYLATCKSGHRYRVHITEQERVAVDDWEPTR